MNRRFPWFCFVLFYAWLKIRKNKFRFSLKSSLQNLTDKIETDTYDEIQWDNLTISKQCEALISLQSSSWVVISVGKEEKRLVSESWVLFVVSAIWGLLEALLLRLGYYCGHSKVGKGAQHERNACGIHFGFLHTTVVSTTALSTRYGMEAARLLGALFSSQNNFLELYDFEEKGATEIQLYFYLDLQGFHLEVSKELQDAYKLIRYQLTVWYLQQNMMS